MSTCALLQLNSDSTETIRLWLQVSNKAGVFPLDTCAEMFGDRHPAPLHPVSAHSKRNHQHYICYLLFFLLAAFIEYMTE